MLGRVSSLVRVDSAQQRLTPSLEVECASICFSSVLFWFAGNMSTSAELLGRKKTDRRPDPGKPESPGAASTRIQPRQDEIAGELQIQISLLSSVMHFGIELGHVKPRFYL